MQIVCVLFAAFYYKFQQNSIQYLIYFFPYQWFCNAIYKPIFMIFSLSSNEE
jgi:hypothetical protein